jgi:hypothetical protein
VPRPVASTARVAPGCVTVTCSDHAPARTTAEPTGYPSMVTSTRATLDAVPCKVNGAPTCAVVGPRSVSAAVGAPRFQLMAARSFQMALPYEGIRHTEASMAAVPLTPGSAASARKALSCVVVMPRRSLLTT